MLVTKTFWGEQLDRLTQKLISLVSGHLLCHAVQQHKAAAAIDHDDSVGS